MSEDVKYEEDIALLESLFPKKEILISGASKSIFLRPLSVEELTPMLRSFMTVYELYISKASPMDIVTVAYQEIGELLPVGMTPKIATKGLPATVLPDLIEAFFELNLNNDVLGKWAALIQKTTDGMGIALVQTEGLRKSLEGVKEVKGKLGQGLE